MRGPWSRDEEKIAELTHSETDVWLFRTGTFLLGFLHGGNIGEYQAALEGGDFMRIFVRYLIKYIGAAAMSFVTSLALAGEKREFYTGIRQLSMGGASIAVVNDETAVLLNPAALGKLRDPFLTVLDPEIHLGEDTTSFMDDFDVDIVTLESIIEKASQNPDRHLHFKAQLFPSFVVPNFGVGVLAKWETNADFDAANNQVLLDYTNDYAAVLGYNLRLWDGRIKLGFSGRYIGRTEVKASDPIDATSTNLEFKDIAADGTAVAADGGLIITLPWDWLPTLSVVVRDIGDTSFTLGSSSSTSGTGTTNPDKVKQSVDAGFAIFPIVGKRTRMTITAEMRDITSEDTDDEDDINRRLHAGVEFNFGDIFFVRGGYNQRYWTAGIEFTMQNFQFQAGSYGEEIGTATNNLEDRRYMGKFAYRF